MINFLHNFNPQAILFSPFGIDIYWYGLFIVSGIIAGLVTALVLAHFYKVSQDVIFDLVFWMVISGIVGARLYHVMLEFKYYLANPLDIIKVWQGGLAIHGGIIAGIIVIIIYAWKKNIFTEEKAPSLRNFWLITAIAAPAVALAQAIGRWGNYFNQELFGKPTDLAWGIPIDFIHKPTQFLSFKYFHPTFLYESLGSLLIFLILIGLHAWYLKSKKKSYEFILITYAILYSLLRFTTEIIRIDPTPQIFGLRFPQIISIFIIIVALVLTIPKIRSKIT
jgi:phosphatidylglycerol:prolipoprotein diacylglycerol transferase